MQPNSMQHMFSSSLPEIRSLLAGELARIPYP
jgi:hypothetical protein